MRIQVGFDLVYDCPQTTPLILRLSVHPSRSRDTEGFESLITVPELPLSTFVDGYGNVCHRLLAPVGELQLSTRAVVKDSGELDVAAFHAGQVEAHDLPVDTLPFLLGSRYCETDLLSEQAWALFAGSSPGWQRVQDICDYVHGHLAFGYEYARATRTAAESLIEGVGVCRDFTHLAIAFCRCLNIPARYCTGYLSDVGVPTDAPPDFSAWLEAFLDDGWYVFDPRNNERRAGRVLMARGRDAADVPLSLSFGPTILKSFKVYTEEIGPVS